VLAEQSTLLPPMSVALCGAPRRQGRKISSHWMVSEAWTRLASRCDNGGSSSVSATARRVPRPTVRQRDFADRCKRSERLLAANRMLRLPRHLSLLAATVTSQYPAALLVKRRIMHLEPLPGV
jgi:hypothetical protein